MLGGGLVLRFSPFEMKQDVVEEGHHHTSAHLCHGHHLLVVRSLTNNTPFVIQAWHHLTLNTNVTLEDVTE